jgi:hypothetical protein
LPNSNATNNVGSLTLINGWVVAIIISLLVAWNREGA